MRVLEVGCGVGTNAFELANFADVFVVGIDSDRSKVRSTFVVTRIYHLNKFGPSRLRKRRV